MSQLIPQTTSPSPGSKGVFLIDKPSGITSHDVVDQVRSLTGVSRVGHTGTLDPLATGLLIVLVGREYTKQQVQFLKLDKEYRCTAKLGVTTDSYDLDGEVLKRADWQTIEKLNEPTVIKALKKFEGEITQTVPAFSAIKQAGKKLYELARKNELRQQDLPTRKVTVHQAQLLEFNKNSQTETAEIVLGLTVSSGTYVRSLVHDLGQELKTGAAVAQLRRTAIGKHKVQNAVTLD